MPDKEKPEKIGSEIEKKKPLLSIASLLVLFGLIVSAVAFLSNLGQMCDSHTIGWRVKVFCDWIAEPKPAPDLQKPILPELKPSPILPKPDLPHSEEDINSDKRLALLKEAAEKWRSRTGPIHENLADLLGSITAYDQTRFENQPEAKKAWDYLQSIQKIINEKSIGITTENKTNISINVIVTGTSDVGDRAARELKDWLEENGFNTDEDNTDIYIDVDGAQSSSPNPYTTYNAMTSLNLIARWLDGSIAFEIHIPSSSKSGGGRDDAENRSFSDAVAKMIRSFQSHVHER